MKRLTFAKLSWVKRISRLSAPISETDPPQARHFIFLVECLMIFDISCDRHAHGRQIKQLIFYEGIVGPLGKLTIYGCMYAKIVRPILHAKIGIVDVGVVTIHRRAFTDRRM